MTDYDVAILVAVVVFWTVIFATAIGILVTWTIGWLHPFVAIPLAFFCAIVCSESATSFEGWRSRTRLVRTATAHDRGLQSGNAQRSTASIVSSTYSPSIT
jgi:hypothetical protein